MRLLTLPRTRISARPLLAALILGLLLVVAPPPTSIDAQVAVRMESVLLQPTSTFADRDGGLAQVRDVAPFAMAAVDAPAGTHVEIRTAAADGRWSPWTELHLDVDEGPDATSAEGRAASAFLGAGRTGSHLIFTDAADAAEVRVEGASVSDVTLHLVDPFGLDRSWLERGRDAMAAAWRGSSSGQAATAVAAMPPIVTRAGWGADETIVRAEPSYARQVDRAFVHHTVGSNSYSAAQAPGVVRGVQSFHVNGRGWNDIGYNFLVDRFGTIYEGRGGGIDQAVIGAQAGGFNTRSTGISFMGTFTDSTPPAAALDAVRQLIAWKADVHHFDPLGTDLALSQGSTRYSEGTEVVLNNVSGHRDVSTTACPGNGPYGQLTSFREGARTLAGDLIVEHASDVTATRVIRGDPDADAVTMRARLDPPGEYVLEVADPDGEVVFRAEGEGDAIAETLVLAGDDWALGLYDWSVASPGRRTAFEFFELDPPVIADVQLSAALATADADGVLDEPLAMSATLWRDADWHVSVTDPAGRQVLSRSGQGAALEAGWFDGVTEPGAYEVTITAEDASPVTRSLEVRYDLLPRVADTDDAVGAATLLSGSTFPTGSATRAVVARDDVFADALAGGPLAGAEGPLLFTPSDGLDPRVVAELDRVLAPGAQLFVLGGPAAISVAVEDALAARYGAVTRLSGASRIDTAVAIAQQVTGGRPTETVLLARAGGEGPSPWADAISGGAFGAATGIPVLLTDSATLSAATGQAISSLGVQRTLLLGGPVALADAVEAAVPGPLRIAGGDRTATAVAVAEQLWEAGLPGVGAVDIQHVLLANGYDADAWAWALASAPYSARNDAPLLLTTPTLLAEPTALHLGSRPGIAGGITLGTQRLVLDEVRYAASDLARR